MHFFRDQGSTDPTGGGGGAQILNFTPKYACTEN